MPPPHIAIARRRGVWAAGVIGIAALVLAVALWPGGDPSTPSALPGPASTDASIGEPTPLPIDDAGEPWAALALPEVSTQASLVANRMDRDQVDPTTAFTLTSLGQLAVADLVETVEVDPPIELTIDTAADGASANLHPRESLEPGRVYRFTIRTPAGAVAGSWAFQAAAPINIVTTIPGDHATKVPVDTGIELTFDQDGVVDLASHFSIEPAVKGTFEQHDRTVVFVPGAALQPATLYTVIVRAGVGIEGSGQGLSDDMKVQFETAPIAAQTTPTPETEQLWYGFERRVIEVLTKEPPLVGVSISASSPALQRAAFPVDVYRLPSESAAIVAVERLIDAPYWSIASRTGLVSTVGLDRVTTFVATPESLNEWGRSAFRLPARLEAGWYLVEIPRPDRPAQTVLQVTEVAAYTAVARDRLIVWAGDTTTGTPLVGATVSVVGGARLGTTDDDGLLVVATPKTVLAAAADPIASPRQQLAVTAQDGRSLIVPIVPSAERGAYLGDVTSYAGADPDRAQDYWRFLTSDRALYRSTDTVHLWGLIGARDAAGPPRNLRLVLTGDSAVDIASVAVEVDRSGAFATDLPFEGLPLGSYTVRLEAGDLSLGEVWFSVDEIRKPSYHIDLSSNRHVVIAGDRVTVTARASFFDGTPVPDAVLAMNVFGSERLATTDRTGTVSLTTAANTDAYVSAQPARSEEAEIQGSTYLRVFPSSVTVQAAATVHNGQIDLTGSLNEVAIERLEAAWPDTWSVDEKGPSVGNVALSVQIIELVAVKTETHRTYDFINKRVSETYSYRWDEVSRSTRAVTSAADGTFGLQFAINAEHEYELRVAARDAAGREVTTWVSIDGPEAPRAGGTSGSLVPYLSPLDCPGATDPYRIGGPICLEVRTDAGVLPSAGQNRYLFFALQRGLRMVVAQDSAELASTFTDDLVPTAEVWAVRFSGTTFTPVENPYLAAFDQEQRRLAVTIEADRARYAPGDTVTLDVWTANAAGDPTAAAVVLRAVDEKLYALGGAYDQDPLYDLYGDYMESGLLWTHGSHPVPFVRTSSNEGGDTSGGGDRSEFADVVLFRKVTTNANGHARVRFKLSDDLTSWHVSASATTAVPEGGSGSILIPVGLPFFVDATLAPEYLAGDRPTLRVRAFGSDLRREDPVTYTITSRSLGMPDTIVSGVAFGDVSVPLPALSTGEHSVTIAGTVRRGGTTWTDRLTRRFVVVDSRFTTTRTTVGPLTNGPHDTRGAGWTTYVFADGGRGRYLELLQSLAWSAGVRLDQRLSAVIARDILVESFGVEREWFPDGPFDPDQYQASGGIALLPYASPDLGQTVRVALIAGARMDRDALAYALREVRNDPTSTRERRNLALAGLAGLRQPVLSDIRHALADPELTIRERLYLALGAAVIGDDDTARAVERDLLAGHGERRGASIRVRVGESLDDTIEGTALMALISAHLSEPFAPDLQAYVEANRAVDDLFNLQQVSFVALMIDRTPVGNAQFAYTVGGERTVVDLGPGERFSLRLLPAQRRVLHFESLAGTVNVTESWQAPRRLEDIVRDPDLGISRTVQPVGDAASPTFVEIRLTATFGGQAVNGCHVVTDLVPSGLAVVERLQVPVDDDPSRFVSPFHVQAQRVAFCVDTSGGRTVLMRYFARVISPGDYVWEAAVIQSGVASESINLSDPSRLTIP